VQPHAVVSYNEWGGYGHPDHIRAHQAARRAADVYGVPFFAVETSGSAAPTDVAVDVSAVIDRKRDALKAHRSQVTVSGDEFTLSNGTTHPIDRVERFRRMSVEAAGEVPFREQSLSSKISVSVLGALVGGATGALVSVYNQSTAKIFGTEIWIGLIVGALVVAALLIGLRLAFATRIVAFWAAVGMIVIVGLFTQMSAGGSLLIPTFGPDGAMDGAGVLWTLTPTVIALIVLVWPQLHRRPPVRIRGQETKVKGPQQP
jgi:N-acetyl-1-D-myo-inositol-2-amino-2-deoxy-alpha-D-glucopyranoside deacetylase